MEQKWGIKFKCSCCGEEVKFPLCENAENDKFEDFAHGIYTARANHDQRCWRCQKENLEPLTIDQF